MFSRGCRSCCRCNSQLLCPSIFLSPGPVVFSWLCCSFGNERNFTKYCWPDPGPKLMQFSACWEMSKVLWQPLLLFSLAIIKQVNGAERYLMHSSPFFLLPLRSLLKKMLPNGTKYILLTSFFYLKSICSRHRSPWIILWWDVQSASRKTTWANFQHISSNLQPEQ